MAEKKIPVAQAVHTAVEPIAQELGLILWDVLFVKEGPSWFLRLIIDKPGGVSLDDCEALSRAADPVIDALDPTELEYYLEVSSPGLGRPLRTDEHLRAYVGKGVQAKLYQPLPEGPRECVGELVGFDAGTVTIRLPEREIILERQGIAALRADDDHI